MRELGRAVARRFLLQKKTSARDLGSRLPDLLDSACRVRGICSIEHDTQPPFLMIGQTANQRIDADGLPLNVTACALVARENREELHRQHGWRRDERFDDALMGN